MDAWNSHITMSTAKIIVTTMLMEVETLVTASVEIETLVPVSVMVMVSMEVYTLVVGNSNCGVCNVVFG